MDATSEGVRFRTIVDRVAGGSMQRVAVVGSSGSGKTTFAHRLAARLGVPRIELDALHWEPGWIEADIETFRARVHAATSADAWVSDGNYSAVRPLVLERADTVVWLDLPLWTCLWRIVRRTARRSRSGEELWGTGNRESWRKVLRRDSLILWLLTTHGRRRRAYEARFADAALGHLRVLRFRSAAEAEGWLASVQARSATLAKP
jgi:adenylate kinase family enzyme